MVLTMPVIEKSRCLSIQLTDLYTFSWGYLGSRSTAQFFDPSDIDNVKLVQAGYKAAATFDLPGHRRAVHQLHQAAPLPSQMPCAARPLSPASREISPWNLGKHSSWA
jgi:hypothetical protein